ncbi:PREDICTED: fractalkine-like [Pseudopodoces humilis]|uniref:fractalkine-like n=1 Tax=Pseudopodoces humilis TaxID=181119 RepID=UPI0006B8016B|nr:PREDICTED: fractalkine-like [Pseudopodoces humilis]
MKAACVPMRLPLLWALCLATLAGAQPKASRRCSVECRAFTKELAEKQIRRYRLTEPSCKKQAIIFITLKDKEICADSKEGWVQKLKDKLDGKNATVMPPHDVASAEEPGSLERQVGLPKVAPPQATAPPSFFQGAGTTLRERIHAPAASTEMPSKSPLGRQDPTQLPAGSTPVAQEEAAHSEVASKAKRVSSNSPASSSAVAAGVGSSQPTLHPTVQGTASPNSNSDLRDAARGSNQPVLPTNGSLDPTNARANTPDTASSSSRSDLPSIWDSMKTTTITETAPQTISVSTLSSTTATGKAASVHTNRVVDPSADVFGTTAFDHSLPVGKQEPSDTVFTHRAFSGQARVQMITVRPKNLPLPSFLSKSQMHFVIPVSVVCGLMVSSVALVWVYLKFGVKPEETSREMVQGLLYQQAGHQDNAYPMEVI